MGHFAPKEKGSGNMKRKNNVLTEETSERARLVHKIKRAAKGIKDAPVYKMPEKTNRAYKNAPKAKTFRLAMEEIQAGACSSMQAGKIALKRACFRGNHAKE
jgi:hypothetical protein